jgi:hypothetical protein
MKKQILFIALQLCVVGAFAQNNRTALVAAKQQLSEAKSYNIALVWQDKQETDRNPGIKKEVLNIFPELANKELNQKNPDFSIQVLVAKPQIIAEKNTTAVVTTNAQGHEVELNYDLPARMVVLDKEGKVLFECKLNEIQNPVVFKEYYKYTDNNGSVTVNSKSNEPTVLRNSVKSYDPMNSGINSTEYYTISTKKQTADLRSLLNAWNMDLNNQKTAFYHKP